MLKSEIISQILAQAVRLWLPTLLDGVGQIDITITGRNQQILRGSIPQITAAAEQAIYQGLHLSAVTLSAADIAIDFQGILRGKSIHLAHAFPVWGKITLIPSDLQASLTAPLLVKALADLWQRLDRGPTPRWQSITLAEQELYLTGEGVAGPVSLVTKVVLGRPQEIHLVEMLLSAGGVVEDLGQLCFDLGEQTVIDHLQITPEQLSLQGQWIINP